MIRRATADDAHVLGHMLHTFNAEFDEPTPDAEQLTAGIRRLIDRDEATFLLVDDDPPAGFAELRFRTAVWTTGLVCYLEELYVRPERRGGGLGRALLEESIRVARERGAVHLELNTSETDEAARRLYESMGFTNRDAGGAVMFYYERDL